MFNYLYLSVSKLVNVLGSEQSIIGVGLRF